MCNWPLPFHEYASEDTESAGSVTGTMIYFFIHEII